MYGYESSEENFDKIEVKPVAKLKSTVTFLKEVKEGTSIGYDRSYIAPKAIKVATIPLRICRWLQTYIFKWLGSFNTKSKGTDNRKNMHG